MDKSSILGKKCFSAEILYELMMMYIYLLRIGGNFQFYRIKESPVAFYLEDVSNSIFSWSFRNVRKTHNLPRIKINKQTVLVLSCVFLEEFFSSYKHMGTNENKVSHSG